MPAAAATVCVDQTTAQIKADEFPFDATQQQKDMLIWHNKARTEPTTLVAELTTMLTHFGSGADDKKYSAPGKTTILTNEGKVAVEEAIAFLNAATPVSAMKWNQHLAFAAEDLAVEQGATTETGHTGPTGSTMTTRIEK